MATLLKNIFGWLKTNGLSIIANGAMFALVILLIVPILTVKKPEVELKDFKDGIQNHLVWGINGKCFFVKPHTDTTVYLIQVPDCNRDK
jgi:hypothetical protein